YLLFDFSTVFPYLAASAVVPVEVLILGGQMPDHDHVAFHWWLNKVLATGIFLLALVPLIFGGKIFNSLKVVMSTKLVLVFGFLLVLGIFFSRPAAWVEIWTGFFKVGNVPALARDAEGNRAAEQPKVPQVENIFVELTQRGRLPLLDFSLIASIAALAAIAGNGGLSNTPVSNYARDQGWGMGDKVGAIPSMIGGRGIGLTHEGCVFEPNEKTLPRWRRWYWFLVRDQLLIWLPACLIGIALPSLLSVEFLPRGTGTDQWNSAVMTAGGVRDHVTSPPLGTLVHATGLTSILAGPRWGNIFWALTLLCGFLVLGTTLVSTIDGIIRRWVDVFWISSRRLREVDPQNIRYVYFGVLIGYSLFGIVMLWFFNPKQLIEWATLGYNFALGFSCWHTLALNRVLLPKPLRPGLVPTLSLTLGGIFFWLLGVVTLVEKLRSVGVIKL
ncbi:MAG TPA: Nramp family divalent metal transporter, partial [Pirellulaceae bacterium]|nr:Nramp family divalent metal transporter [Pirellulaceae bacterium]